MPTVDSSVYYDCRRDIAEGFPLIMVIGGRGIGKTYSGLDYIREEKQKFIYLRNSQKELDISCSELGNPYKAINLDKGSNYQFESSEGFALCYDKSAEVKTPVGYGAALSTFSNLRGVDMSDCDITLFDEFLQLNRSMKKQADYFFNFYETVNRNRELRGKPPMKVLMFSNSVTLNNPILSAMGLIPIITNMIKTGQQRQRIREKGLMVVMPKQNALVEAKSQTFLYRLTEGSEYYDHALGNEFVNDSFTHIKKRDIAEYTPLCGYDTMYIYRHKSNGMYYVSRSRASCDVFDKDSMLMFMRQFGLEIRLAIMDGKIEYCDYSAKMYLTTMLIK